MLRLAGHCRITPVLSLGEMELYKFPDALEFDLLIGVKGVEEAYAVDGTPADSCMLAVNAPIFKVFHFPYYLLHFSPMHELCCHGVHGSVDFVSHTFVL